MFRLLLHIILLFLLFRLLFPLFKGIGKLLGKLFTPVSHQQSKSEKVEEEPDYSALSPYEIEDADYEEVKEDRK
jgi:hypothetical protein